VKPETTLANSGAQIERPVAQPVQKPTPPTSFGVGLAIDSLFQIGAVIQKALKGAVDDAGFDQEFSVPTARDAFGIFCRIQRFAKWAQLQVGSHATSRRCFSPVLGKAVPLRHAQKTSALSLPFLSDGHQARVQFWAHCWAP
jgi:hypothetical protein